MAPRSSPAASGLRRGLLLPVLVVLCGVVTGRADAEPSLGRQLRKVDRREAAYWKSFDKRFGEAANAWYEPVRVHAHTGDNEPAYDYRPLRKLLDDLMVFERAREDVYRQAEALGPDAALAFLYEQLVDTLKKIARVERDFESLEVRKWRHLLDQQPSFRRHALGRRQDLLEALIGQQPGAAAFLVRRLPAADKVDARLDEPRNQIAIVDILARSGSQQAAPALGVCLDAASLPLRIAAVEALVAVGATSACLSVLEQGPLPLQRAFLAALLRTDAASASLAVPIAAAYRSAQGPLRRDCIRVLQHVTGTGVGDVPEFWEQMASAIGTGGTRPMGPETSNRPPAPSFYGIAPGSSRLLFLLEGAFSFTMPADHALQRTRSFMNWGTWGAADWKREHPSHQDVLATQIEALLAGLGDREGAFRIAMLGHPANTVHRLAVLPAGSRSPLALTPKNAKRAGAFVRDHKVSFVHDIHFGLLQALAWPEHDTVLLWAPGVVGGGRIALPELVLEDFRRRNRFRRIVVHAIQVCDMGPEPKKLMEGLAAASDGVYRWARTPPE